MAQRLTHFMLVELLCQLCFPSLQCLTFFAMQLITKNSWDKLHVYFFSLKVLFPVNDLYFPFLNKMVFSQYSFLYKALSPDTPDNIPLASNCGIIRHLTIDHWPLTEVL